MSDKTWYIVYTRHRGELYRYAIEHKITPEFEDEFEYDEWRSEMEEYFQERTAIKEEVVAIEPADFMLAYSFKEDL